MVLIKRFNTTQKPLANRKLMNVFFLFIFISTFLTSCVSTQIQQNIKEYPVKEANKALVICGEAAVKQFIPFRSVRGAYAFSSGQPSEEFAILSTFWLVELTQTNLKSCSLVQINNSSVSELNAAYWKNFYFKNNYKYKFTYKDSVGVVVEKND